MTEGWLKGLLLLSDLWQRVVIGNTSSQATALFMIRKNHAELDLVSRNVSLPVLHILRYFRVVASTNNQLNM